MQQIASGEPTLCHSDGCIPHEPPPWYIKPLELTCSVAFVIFGVMTAPTRFVVFLGVGAVYEFTLIILKVDTSAKAVSRPGCGQGNGELLADRGLLHFEVVLATALLFFEHLHHDPEFFVPFVGFWAGSRSVRYIHSYVRKGNVPQVVHTH